MAAHPLSNQLCAQPMPISGPAMVAHGYKPNGYYTNPNTAFAAGSSMALLQIRTHLRGG